MNAQTKIPQEIKELVIIRLETLPSDKKISIGSFGEFSKEELVEHVKKDDEIGKKLVEVELEFLRALKEGIVI
ncbi:hypothetical protein HY636_02315 [Candidatus Woesearchaeota archaeon]|nr:hypothetical protein [Candidatus Woesearchaeota archaeon]